MNRFLLATLTLISTAGLSTAQARTLAEIKKSGVLNIFTNAEYEPFMYYDANKNMTGFEYDLGNEIAKRLGVKAVWTDRPFAGLLTEVNSRPKDVDMVVASHSMTSTRAKQVNFSNPHYCTGSAILSHVGGPQTSKDLIGHTVGAEVGSVNLAFLRKLPQVSVKPFPSSKEAIQGVIDGKITATVDDISVLLQTQKANPDKNLLVSNPLWRSGAGVAFLKGKQSDELRQAVNVALKNMMQDGTYNTISQKWFGRNFRC